MFECDRCGCCCRSLDKNSLYAQLDRGDGVCIYLDGDQCSIYNDRPLICRIDECYDRFFSGIMSKEDYYRVNYEACKRLKEMEE